MKKRNRSILVPILTALIPVIAVSFSGFSIVFNLITKNQIYSIKTELGSTVTSDIDRSFEIWIEDQLILAKILASEPAVIEACLEPSNPELYSKASEYFKRIHDNYDFYENIYALIYYESGRNIVINVDGKERKIPDGSIFISGGDSNVLGLAADRNYSTEIRKGKDFFISEVYLSMASNTPVFVISVPIVHQGRLIGAAGVAPKMKYFTERFEAQEHFGENEYVFMMDEGGNMIAHKDSSLILTEEGKTVLIPYLEKVRNKEFIFEQEFRGSMNLYIVKKMEAFSDYKANNWYFFYRESLQDMLASLDRIRNLSLTYVVILIAVISLIVFFVARIIILSPLKTVEGELDLISRGGGDLTTSIKIKSMNEVGRIALSFNTFTETLREMIIKIKKSVNTNSELRDKLASSTEETSAAVNEILSNIKSIQSVIRNLVEQTQTAEVSTSEIRNGISKLTYQAENQSSAVEQSTAAVEEMISSLKNMAGTTTRNKETSDKLLKSVEEGSEMLDETYSSIQKVTTNIDSIMEMTDVIDNISNQTNLLAMNAAIEAAHAGEAGKGFAVVADEIRKLAEDSSSSSNNIAQEVKTIIDQIKHSSDYSKKLQTVINGMVEELRKLALAFAEINSSSIEMSAGSDQVLNAMTSLSEISVQLSLAAEKMKNDTDIVSSNMGSVLELTQTANAAIEEISFGSNEILSAITNMQDNVQTLAENTDTLSGEVDSFKTEK